MRWFGSDPWAEACDRNEHIDTPMGEFCAGCGEEISPSDSGYQIPHISNDQQAWSLWHRECFIFMIFGAHKVEGMSFRNQAIKKWEELINEHSESTPVSRE